MVFLMAENKITAIKVQAKNPNRVSIYLDGEFAFGLSRITAAWLSTGRCLKEAEILKLKNEDELEMAYQKALHYLSFRPRSSQEVRQSLNKKGFGEQVIEKTLERLQEQSYVNDLDFSEQWIENRSTFRPRSQRLLTYELRQKGISDETILQALEAMKTPEEELATKAVLSRMHREKFADWKSFQKKIGTFLARRGFSYGVIASVLKKIWNDLEGEKNLD